MRVFSFFVDGELFAVDVDRVQKIARKIEVTFVPCAPDAITGIINLKGRVITVFSLYNLLERGEKNSPQREVCENDLVNIIIFKSLTGDEDQMGLVMDRPGVLVDIEDEMIRVPSLATGAQESYCISGIAEINNTLYRIINIDSIIERYKNNGEKTAENISDGGMYDN